MIVLNWKDKRGYTLVELIISMAILAIVGGAITLLMQSGSRSYSNTKAELDLQMESQTLMAQLNTMIMESNCVKYDDVNNALILYQIDYQTISYLCCLVNLVSLFTGFHCKRNRDITSLYVHLEVINIIR